MSNKNKIISILALFLVLFIMAGAVSAANADITVSDVDDGNDTLNVSDTLETNVGTLDDNLEEDVENVGDAASNGGVSNDDTSFEALYNLINSGKTNIELNHDYIYGSGSMDSLYKSGITINNDLTINGNGHTIDGKNLARIFSISSTVTLNNITFANGNATDGGAIYTTATLIITNCKFINNNAYNTTTSCDDGRGGAIYFESKTQNACSNSCIENCTFTDNLAHNMGGAIYITDNTNSGCNNIIIMNSNFTNNRATSDSTSGGAIYISSKSSINNLKIENSIFDNNTVRGSGAAIAIYAMYKKTTKFPFYEYGAKNYLINNVTFINNRIDDYVGSFGGAIYIYTTSSSCSNFNINNSKFINNSAYCGGAIYTNGKSLNINSSVFENNNATKVIGEYLGQIVEFKGAALYVAQGATVTVTGSNFTGNNFGSNMNTDNVTAGAAIYNAGTLTVTGSEFENNTAKQGGAIYNVATLTVNGGSEFNNNTATVAGGAIYNDATLTMADSTFTENTLNLTSNGNGGAIYNDATLNIDNCTFTENLKGYNLTYEINGGVIYTGDGSSLNIYNSAFLRNCYGAEYNNSNSKLTARSINGGCIYSSNANVLINNTLFDENTGRWGSVALFENGSAQVLNSNITNSNVYDGAFYCYSNVNFTNCKFENNTAKYVGSTGYMASGTDLMLFTLNGNTTVDNCTFTNSKVTSSVAGAGSIHLQAYSGYKQYLTIKNSKFTNISSPSGYAAIYSNNSELVLDTVLFENCSAENGGAIYNDKNIVCKIYNSNFTNCKVVGTLHGGAIYALSGGFDLISNCSFVGCSAKNGGAIYSSASDFNISDSSFENCYSTNIGGAIYINNQILNVTNCTFKNDSAVNGGAIYTAGSNTLNVGNNSSFIDCYASGNSGGGAIYTAGTSGTSKVYNSSFMNCYAKTSGGAIYIYSAPMTVYGCNFTDCYTINNKGGVIYGCGNLNVSNSSFVNGYCNTTSSNGLGGAIYSNKVLNVTDCNFTSYCAYRGGAIYKFGSYTCTITGCKFENCNASNYGGAVMNYNKVVSKIYNSTFINCSSTSSGGAIMNWYNSANCTVSKCNFTKCTSNSGIINNNNAGILTLEHSIINETNGYCIFNVNKLNMNNVTITNNNNIAWVVNSKGVTNITNCNISDNIVYDTIINAVNSTVNVKDTVFDSNDVKNGVVINSAGTLSAAKLNVTGCTFSNNAKVTSDDISTGDGVITSGGTSELVNNTFTSNANSAILANLAGGNTTIGDDNSAESGNYIINNGTLNGAHTVLNEPYVGVEINPETMKSVTTVTFTGEILTDSGDILVIDSNVNNATLTCTNGQNCTLTTNGVGYYTGTIDEFDAVPGVKLYPDSLAIGDYTADDGNVLPTSAPNHSLSQLKEMIDAWNTTDTLELSTYYSYNASCDSELSTIVLNKTISIDGFNDNVLIDTSGSNMDSLFTITDGATVFISDIDFDSDSASDVKIADSGATLTIVNCTSDNLKSIYYVAGTVNNMNATVNNNLTSYTIVGKDFDLTGTVTVDGLKVYGPNFELSAGDVFDTSYDDGVYTATGNLANSGVYTATITGVSDVSTGTVVVLDSSSIIVYNASCTHGDMVNITVCLEYAISDDYKVNLYLDMDKKGTATFDDFTEIDGKYYYNYTIATAGITLDSVSLWASILNDDGNVVVTSDKTSYLTLTGTDPEIEAISVSGNYSTKVNITVKVTKGNVTGDKIVLHLIDGDNITATVNETGYAVFNNVVLTKAGNYTTKVVYTRSYGSGYYYLATANVTWNISKISTNITFAPENVTGAVNQTCHVVVSVNDYYENAVKSGQITVTGTGIQLVDSEGNPYNGTVYNLTNGAVTVHFKYLSEGVYTPNFNYTNANSTYSNNNNYYYSNANLNVNITKATVNITVYESSRNVSGRVYDNITIKGNVSDVTGVIPVGNVTITVNGTDYNATVGADGTFTIVVNASAAFTGNDISVKFISGNTTMWNDTNSTSPNLVNITINLISTNVTVNPVTYTKNAGEAFNITGNVTTINSTVVPTGKVAIKINGTTYDAYLNADGTYSIPVTVNNSGTWNNLNVTFTSNQTEVLANNVSGNIVNVTINKLDTVINITDVSAEYVVYVNETLIINGTVTASNGENAAGNVTITVNGQNFTADVVDGVFHLNVNSTVGLDKAAYNITFTSNDTGRWNNCIGEDIVNITVNKLNTTIALTTSDVIVVVWNETFYINGTVTDDVYGNGVVGNVTITINGKSFNDTVGADGKFSIVAHSEEPFDSTIYDIKFSDFNESVYNAPADKSINLTVLSRNCTINVISVNPVSGSVYVDDYIVITGNVTDDFDGRAVSWRVQIKVNGQYFSNNTDENGSFVLNVTSSKALARTNYEIYGIDSNPAGGGSLYNEPKSANVSLEFKKLPTKVTVDTVTYTGKVNSTITITGTVNDTIYNKAANGTVFLTLNGKEFNTTVDPTTGKFSLNVSCNVSGTYKKLIVRYGTNDTDRWVNSTSSKITITIEALNVYIISNYDLTSAYNASFNRVRNYTFNVTDELGNKVQNGTLKLHLRNGTLTQTVSNGQATFKDILFNDTGSYVFMLSYVGNKFYNSVSNATKIIVAKVATTIYINGSVKDTSKFLNITVKDNIDNKTVIKGTIYYVTPDGQGHEITLTNGSATFNVTANRTGEYDIAVSYYDLEQDYLYSTEDFKYNITVAGIETQFQGVTDPANGELIENTLLITSTVRDDNGNLIEDGVMNYCVGGNYYTANVVNGVATLEVDGFTGPVMVIAQFDGVDCTQSQEVYVVEPASYNVNGNLATVVA